MSISKLTSYKILNYYPLEISFDLDFCINGAKIYTTDSLPNQEVMLNKSDTDIEDYLVIEIWTQLDSIDSWVEGKRYTRPTILTLLSIISYLLDYPLTIYQSPFGMGESIADEKPDKIEVLKFTHDHVDKSNDLLEILKAIYLNVEEDINQFIVSALGRWHKARYLEEQSHANLYDEESFLAYFHIMELFSGRFSNQQVNEAQDQIKEFIKNLLTSTMKFRDNHLEQVIQEKYKIVRSILLFDGQIPIVSKICYFLDEVGLLDSKTQYFVEQMVKIRNSIAHGRNVYHKELNWPLPPFFPINLDAERYIFEMRVFTGCGSSALNRGHIAHCSISCKAC